MDFEVALEAEVSGVVEWAVFRRQDSGHTSLEVFRALVEGS